MTALIHFDGLREDTDARDILDDLHTAIRAAERQMAEKGARGLPIAPLSKLVIRLTRLHSALGQPDALQNRSSSHRNMATSGEASDVWP